jgi:hypothetical protein
VLAALAAAACGDDDGPLAGRDAGAGGSAGAFDAGVRDDVRDGIDAGANEPDASSGLPTLVVLPDTQFYACYYEDVFLAQTGWIRDHAAQQNIRMAIHTGDIVDRDEALQWENAASAMRLLDGVVPYLTAPGNHDLLPDRRTMMNAPAYFPLASFQRWPWFAAAYDAKRSDNMAAVVELDGRPWLVLGLEWSPRDKVVEWAARVLTQHADKPAILFTHAYLYGDGTRYDHTRPGPLQPFSPYNYGYTAAEGINDGEDLWQKLVSTHSNVRLVFSGHVIPDVPARLTSVRPDGTRVHQILANYQRCAACPCEEVKGGGGFLRLVRFDRPNRRLIVETYSPYLGESKLDGANAFELPLDD